MSASNVASHIAVDAVLRAGSRRILAQRCSAGALVDLDFDCDASISTGQAALVVGVLREAILNSIDYAHPAGVLGKIRLSTALVPDGSFMIEVVDNGVGLPEGFDPVYDGGNGFRTMRRAAAALGADLSFKSSSLGLAVGLHLPAPAEQLAAG